MNFRSKYDFGDRKKTCPGDPLKVKYKGYYNDNGNFDLVETGTDNLYQYIQSFKDSVDIHVILSKYINGDISALNARNPLFGDFSSIPDNFPALLNTIRETEDLFNKLPVDVKEKFGNNFAAFAASVGTPEFAEKLQRTPIPQAEVAQATPVVESESEVHPVTE